MMYLHLLPNQRSNHSSGSHMYITSQQWIRALGSAIGLIAALLLCGACIGEQQRQGPLVEGLLNDVPCAAPCWEGITPGTTTEQEAIDILLAETRSSYMTEPSIAYRDDTGKVVVRWITKATRMPSGVSSVSELHTLRHKTHHVSLTLDTGLTAQMIIEKWGEPAIVFVYQAGRHPPHFWAQFCYPEQGIELGVFMDSGNDPLVLDPDDRVSFAYFYAPMSREEWLTGPVDQHSWMFRPTDPDKILEWIGFGTISPEVIIYT
jgi:hypothetical protein